MTDEDFMALALAQARQAALLGEVPVGAVVVRHGEVIAMGCNAMIGTHDPTASMQNCRYAPLPRSWGITGFTNVNCLSRFEP